jgi:hypothetical protein
MGFDVRGLDRRASRPSLESLSFAVLETRSLSLEMRFASRTRVADVLFAASLERLILVSVVVLVMRPLLTLSRDCAILLVRPLSLFFLTGCLRTLAVRVTAFDELLLFRLDAEGLYCIVRVGVITAFLCVPPITVFTLLLLGRTTSTVRLTLLERDRVVLVLKLNLTEPLFPLDVVFVRLDSKALVFPGVLFLL